MRRDVYLMMVAFWTSVPLLAVSLAAIWPQRDPPWPVAILWLVVMASSAFLTVQGSLFLACYPFGFPLSGFSF